MTNAVGSSMWEAAMAKRPRCPGAAVESGSLLQAGAKDSAVDRLRDICGSQRVVPNFPSSIERAIRSPQQLRRAHRTLLIGGCHENLGSPGGPLPCRADPQVNSLVAGPIVLPCEGKTAVRGL